MRRSLLAAIMLLLAAPAFAQLPAVKPIPFKPYVPPVHCAGKVGRDFIRCVIPDQRELAAASFYNTGFEPTYDRLYGRPRIVVEPLPEPRPEDDPTRAVVRFEVPADAEVWLEGRKMRQTGAARRFVSPPLQADRDYEYGVRVRWHDGKTRQERTLQVPVRAGDRPVVIVPAGS